MRCESGQERTGCAGGRPACEATPVPVGAPPSGGYKGRLHWSLPRVQERDKGHQSSGTDQRCQSEEREGSFEEDSAMPARWLVIEG